MRKRILTGVLAALASLALALPAYAADPAYYIDANNGRVVVTVVNPDDPTCSAEVAVDLHRGYSSSTDGTANAVSGVVRITRQGTAVRVQVDNIRIGSVASGFVDVNDLFPSPSASNRNNTPAGGTVIVSTYRVDLMDEADFTGDTDPPYEPRANGLNSSFDFSAPVNPLRAYSDWVSTTADLNPTVAGDQTLGTQVQVRAYGTMRCRSGDLFRWSVLSNPTSTDA